MKQYVLALCAALLLAACGTTAPASSTSSTPDAPTADAPTQAATTVAPTMEATSAAGATTMAPAALVPLDIPLVNGAPPELWVFVGCVEQLGCEPLDGERAATPRRENAGATWCIHFRGSDGEHTTVVDQFGAEAFDRDFLDSNTPEQLEALGCNRIAQAATARLAAAALPTPTLELDEAAQVVGEPLPEGTLELSECRSDRGCTAVITEKAPNDAFSWCVVLERDGARENWLYLVAGDGLPNAQPSSAEQFTGKGCTTAATVAAGG